MLFGGYVINIIFSWRRRFCDDARDKGLLWALKHAVWGLRYQYYLQLEATFL
jgi:hypothetical protein